jgi:hypothetical protein
MYNRYRQAQPKGLKERNPQEVRVNWEVRKRQEFRAFDQGQERQRRCKATPVANQLFTSSGASRYSKL